MGNVLAANVPPTALASLPNVTNGMCDGKMMLWKLTRVMKAAGWVYKSSGKGNVTGTLGKDASLSTTCNNTLTLPQATITVISTTGFPVSGTIFVVTAAGTQTVTYTGTTATTFTGASGGSGAMAIGNPVIPANAVAANPNNDLWNGYGDQIPGQSGSAASATGGPIAVITGLTGMTANSVGRVLIISNATNTNNNGVYRIVTFTSATQVSVFNSGANTDTNNGRLIWQEMDSAAYVSGQIGANANITTVSTPTRIVTITGLTGMTPLSTNRYLTITGAASTNNNGTFKILSFLSSTSVTIINFSGVASDANNGSITWKEMDPLLENYLLLNQNTWLCMQGPSTLKIPITAAATGTFLRGENITQTTTGAQGEIIGYTFDTVATAGYLVVMPRVHGTGAGALGWGTNLITGGTSGATVTPSANPLEFTREAVFYCPGSTNSSNAVTMWMQVVDGYTAGSENASRFSVLQASIGCTAAVPPGGAGTANAFPVPGTQTFMGSSTTGTNSWGNFNTNSSPFGYSHFMCADTTYDTGRSADGSFCGAVAQSNVFSTNINGSYIGCLWTRCDAQEDGDVDPYIFYLSSSDTIYTGLSRTAAGTESTNTEHFTASSTLQSGGAATWGGHTVRAWRRRGFATGDGYQNCSLFTVGHVNAASSGFTSASTGSLNQYNDPANIVNRNNSVVGEPIWVISAQNLGRVRKGTMRWARLVNIGTATDLYHGGLYIQLSSSLPAMIVGPWDKRTVPIR